MSIRKFKRDVLSAPDLLRTETMTPAMLELMQGIVKARLNVLMSGGTGAGKTTLLNVLSESIPTTDTYGERIVDDSFLVIFNASDQPIDWCIPGPQWSRRWTIDLDTADPKRGSARTVNKRPGDTLEVLDRSMVVLRSITPPSRVPARRRTVQETI